MDPLVIVGSKVPKWGNVNLRLPSSQSSVHSLQYFVVEGDDYRDHFLELQPYAVVVTNIEYDHPDYFRDLEHTVESFRKLAEKVPENGFVAINEDDPGCQQLQAEFFSSPIRANWRIEKYGQSCKIFGVLPLQVPGEFNRYNATAAATAALALGVPQEVVEQTAREFRGVWRRFEVVGTLFRHSEERGDEESRGSKDGILHSAQDDSILVISDYAHHPTAIRATMKAAREAYPGRRLVLVYQPHQHSRTKRLFNDFVEVLKDAADVVIVSEIYAVKGRMEEQDITSKDLITAIKTSNLITQEPNNLVLYGGDLEETKRVVLEHAQTSDIIIFMGAGDIDQVARDINKISTNTK